MVDGGGECPSCGGSGGGPFGRPGSAWDVEGYVCPRCKGLGVLRPERSAASTVRPLAKGIAQPPARVVAKRGPVSTRPAAKKTKRAAGTKRTK